VALGREADAMRMTFFFRSSGVEETNVFVLTGNKLANNFASLITNGLGPHVAAAASFTTQM
jgi:hypothetical protein